MSKLKLSILSGFALIIVLGIINQRHAVACEFVGLSSYSEIAPKIFISPTISQIRYDEIIAAIAMGRERVNNTFGEMVAFPNIVVAASKSEAASFGSNETGTAHLTPLGECIVLGPDGHNADVAAHEFVHAEVRNRGGWLANWFEIPTWFNEGVALLVDHREPFLTANIQLSQEEIEAVRKLNSGEEFFGGTNVHKNYLASRLAVNNVEPLKLYENLILIRNGNSFDSVFNIRN